VLPGTWVYTYDRASRMVTAARNGTTALSARYDGLERRVEKTAGSAVTRYIYDPDGQILAEINAANGQAIREYIWLGGLPVGLVERGSGSAVLRFVHADHLARPQKITAANRSLVWDGQYAPFGETHSVTGTITNVLLFPGQLADPETGLSQNWHRDYDPSLGRYLQPDPLGLSGGVNTFAYAGGNPVANIDPDGRLAFAYPVAACFANPAACAAALGKGAEFVGSAIGAGYLASELWNLWWDKPAPLLAPSCPADVDPFTGAPVNRSRPLPGLLPPLAMEGSEEDFMERERCRKVADMCHDECEHHMGKDIQSFGYTNCRKKCLKREKCYRGN
jgi:RHS repeat-associated protein